MKIHATNLIKSFLKKFTIKFLGSITNDSIKIKQLRCKIILFIFEEKYSYAMEN